MVHVRVSCVARLRTEGTEAQPQQVWVCWGEGGLALHLAYRNGVMDLVVTTMQVRECNNLTGMG